MDYTIKSRYWHLSYWSATWRELPGKQRKLFRIVMLIQFLLTLFFICNQGINSDEGGYFSYAVTWAKGQPERTSPIMDSKTPMVAFSLIPALFKQWLPANLLADDHAFYLKAGRPFMYIYQLLGCYIVFCWLTHLWGSKKWLIPFLFFCFDPLIFSYSMFVGSDLPSAAILVTVIYSAWRYAVTNRKKYWWMLCVATAWGLVLKQTFVYCLPLLVILTTIHALQIKQWNWKKAGIQLAQFVLVQVVFINIVYYFKGTGASLGEIHFKSELFTHLQAVLHFMSGIPIPLPAAFIQGFDLLQHNAEYGCCKPESTYEGIILFGNVLLNRTFWYYYIGTALFKMPLFVLGVFFIFIIHFFTKQHIGARLKKHVFIWLPFVYFLLILSFLNQFQIGIRHAILVLPFFYIGISGAFIRLFEKKRWLFGSLVFLHGISLVRYWPNMIAYTNELVWNKTNAYQIIADSSIDYGQTNLQLNKFLKEHPDYTLPPNTPIAGKFAVTLHQFVDRFPGSSLEDYSWLRNHIKPVSHYNYTILLFHVTEADLIAKGLMNGHR